ncbi:MAG: hypothetical protein ACRYG7_16905 [Janthinobacterium lividum]
MDTIVFTSSWHLAVRHFFTTTLVISFLYVCIILLLTAGSFDEPVAYEVLRAATPMIKFLAAIVLPLQLLISLVFVSGGYVEASGDAQAIVFHWPYALFNRTQVVPLETVQSVTLKSFKTRSFTFQQLTGKPIGVGFDFLHEESLTRFAAFLRAHAVTPINF